MLVSLTFQAVICYKNWPHAVTDSPQTVTVLSISMDIKWTISLMAITGSIVLPQDTLVELHTNTPWYKNTLWLNWQGVP